ncbi:energy transducer TonB [Flavobacterium beibuense]|uniref:Outer membrane transport energization protein TonB n=1 Tax=Flavobacterium beibuense TaxID=657326 RepID=A0A444W7N1_9FLAO|nr:energy transducer TonB [Flavobacterium beibuense]RYJ41879.1 Outer membrane transport energization protein TonB [Flavobacterium beibuense]
MKYLETENERKSFAITVTIFAILLILCFFLGMKYMDPPPENGIAINFGTTDFGQGDIQPTEPIQSAPQPQQSVPESNPVTEEVVTQDVDDAPVINDTKPKKETPKPTEKPKETPKPPTPSKSTTDALNSLINGPKSEGKATQGQGDSNQAGDQGKIDGSLQGGYGNGGKGTVGTGNGNYQLGGRNAIAKPQPKYLCNEQGKVVVEISVDRSGRVISAKPGARGTTNNAACLLEQAKIAAMNTTWEPDSDAPDKQIGKIIYNFTLTD